MIDLVVTHYITSRDFNGISIPLLMEKTGYCEAEMGSELRRFVEEGRITLTFGCMGNPFIKAFDPPPVEVQVALLFKDDWAEICAYPTPVEVREHVDLRDYDNRPFTKELAVSQPQLRPVYFEMAVLERYHNDPRYLFVFDDYRGMICRSDSYDESQSVPERDKVFLQDFGLGYDLDGNRVVVVYLRRLNGLSPEHQQYWQTFALDGGYQMCDDYYRNTIQGEFAEGVSVYKAFLEDQRAINKSCHIMGRQPLFRKTFVERRPRRLSRNARHRA